MIAICNQAAFRTDVLPHRERLADICPAQTRLTRATRIDFHQQASGAFCLVRKHEDERRPSGVVNRLTQPTTNKPFYIQILDGNQTVVVNNLARFFVVKVSALIANMIVEPLEQQVRFSSAVRAFLSSRYPPLQTPEIRLGVTKPARVINRVPITHGGERDQANVDAGCVCVEGQWLCCDLNGEQGEPSARFSFDRQSFDYPFNRSVKINADAPDFRDPQFVPIERVSDLSKSETVVTTHRTKARTPRFITAFHSAKECLKPKMYTFEHVLQRLRVYACHVFTQFLNFRQLDGLIKVRDGLALPRPRFPTFLQASVIHLAANGKLIIENPLLLLGWINTVAKRLNHGPILQDGFSV